jgi:hypothetical protein
MLPPYICILCNRITTTFGGLAILKRAEAELLSELTPEQRVAAEKSLGDIFVYSDVKGMKELREELKASKSPKNVDRK